MGLRWRAFVAEFVGTFALIFIGVGAVVNHAGLVGIALAHGLTIAVMASATAAVSGGHLNPAVTAGALAARKIDLPNAVGYWVFQVGAGIAAAASLRAIYPIPLLDGAGYGLPTPGAGISNAGAFVAELVLTFFLMFVVYGTAVDARGPKVGALFIGLTVTLDILMGAQVSGASMNPARYMGPAVAMGDYNLAWLYWTAPIAGAVLAALVYRYALEGPRAIEARRQPFPLGPVQGAEPADGG